jgi:hypothetical protein
LEKIHLTQYRACGDEGKKDSLGRLGAIAPAILSCEVSLHQTGDADPSQPSDPGGAFFFDPFLSWPK